MNAHRTLALLIASALVSAGCSGSTESSQSSSTAASADATEVALANLAERQRTCIDALKAHLTALKVTRIDAFLGQTPDRIGLVKTRSCRFGRCPCGASPPASVARATRRPAAAGPFGKPG